MVGFLAYLINLAANILEVLVVVDAVVSFFLSPLHPFRQTLDRIVDPLLAPIRRVVPPLGMFDLSPIVLIFLIEIVRGVLLRLLYSL
ncbi:MAG: YggT family protein [Chloroflexi bacterium]|nr:YggT family protein [Chloroflexota bacterium]